MTVYSPLGPTPLKCETLLDARCTTPFASTVRRVVTHRLISSWPRSIRFEACAVAVTGDNAITAPAMRGRNWVSNLRIVWFYLATAVS